MCIYIVLIAVVQVVVGVLVSASAVYNGHLALCQLVSVPVVTSSLGVEYPGDQHTLAPKVSVHLVKKLLQFVL